MADSSGSVDTERTISHDDFDPVGTLALIALYFAVLVLMWIVTYFVEFLRSDPTPVGYVVPGGDPLLIVLGVVMV